MKVLKYIPKLIDIDIQEITLLSAEEYDAAKEFIKPIAAPWWLCSQGKYDDYAMFVDTHGNLDEDGLDVRLALSIRPALRLKSDNLQLGDKFHYGGYDWMVITDSIALCDAEFRKMAFREDWVLNIYEKSDIKKYLDEWLEGRR